MEKFHPQDEHSDGLVTEPEIIVDKATAEFEPTITQMKQYANEVLRKQPNSIDSYGRPRPIFEVNNRRVCFRNRQEIVTVEGRNARVITGAEEYPVMLGQERDEKDFQAKNRVAEYAEAASAVDGDNMIVVTNTPESIVTAASILASNEVVQNNARRLLALIQDKQYAHPDIIDLIDGIIGSVSVGDDGALIDTQSGYGELNTDGFAVVLASLSGDAVATKIIDEKREQLRQNERTRMARTEATLAVADPRQHEVLDSVEIQPLPLHEMALVHTTKHEIQRNGEGNIVLRPSGQYPSDHDFPRATLHFTINSRVAPHTQALEGAWASTDSMIVAPFGAAADTNGKPGRLNGVDTWFAIGPGEAMILPGAVIVQPDFDPTRQTLIEEADGVIKFRAAEGYTDHEKTMIEDMLRNETPFRRSINGDYVGALKEIALNRALRAVGVPSEAIDQPSQDGHGLANHLLSERIQLTAKDMGVRTGVHFHSSEAQLEHQVASIMSNYLLQQPLNPSSASTFLSFANKSDLRMRRQVLVNGYYPAAPSREDSARHDFRSGRSNQRVRV